MAEEKNYLELYRKVRKVFDEASLCYKELMTHAEDVDKATLKAVRVGMAKAKAKCLAYQIRAKKQQKLAKNKTQPKSDNNQPAKASSELVKISAAPIAKSISGSVGMGGKNNAQDVKVVQTLLNKHGNSLVVDGDCGGKSIKAIIAFQKKVMNGFSDGKIDPGGKTWGFLSKGGSEEDTESTTEDKPVVGNISDSVGLGGKNDAQDVKIVQTLLNKHGNSLVVDGDCGGKSVKAIIAFQKSVLNGFSDGLISVGGKTWGFLSKGGEEEVVEVSVPDKEEQPEEENSQETMPPVAIVPIKAAVGDGGANNIDDVKVIQTLLNKHGNKLAINGDCGQDMISAIRRFQASMGSNNPDGRVDPNGRSWKALMGEKIPDASGLIGPIVKPNWIKVAEGEMGVKENTSKTEHNPRVMAYHATTGITNNDETPWCSSFVNWVMKKAGKGGTDSAMAISWKRYGKDLGRPAYGAIAVIDWDGPGPGWKGHVGFVVGKKGSSVLILGGNQSNAVNIKSFGTSKIVAWVVPSDYEVPASAYTFGEASGDFGGMDLDSTR